MNKPAKQRGRGNPLFQRSPLKRVAVRPRALLKESLFFSWVDCAKTAGILVLTIFIGELLRAWNLGSENLILVYILSVLIVSLVTEGYAYGIFAAVVSVVAFDFLITKPRFGFSITQAAYPITFLIMLFVSLITSTLTIRVKTQALLAMERGQRTDILYEFNKKLLATRGLEHIIDLANEHISNLLHRSVLFYHDNPEKGATGIFCQYHGEVESSWMLSPMERGVAHSVFDHSVCAGAGTEVFPEAQAFYMPLIYHNKVLGVLAISCKNGNLLNEYSITILGMMASQVAMAMQLQRLSDAQSRILLEAEKEKMRSNLLRAISHDLRTPLTGILGASSVILERGENMEGQTRDKMVADIREDAQWLISLVENLLSVTRIHEDPLHVIKATEAVEEIVAEAVRHIRKRFPNRAIRVQVPNELLMVPMDGMLIVQVLINLLENAVKNSVEDAIVSINVRYEEPLAVFEVRDQGRGIAPKDLPGLFQGAAPRYRQSADSSRGMGLGLSICMSIIHAHHGEIEAENHPEGGALFRFTLPTGK